MMEEIKENSKEEFTYIHKTPKTVFEKLKSLLLLLAL